MFLSNPAKSFLAGALIVITTAGCGLLARNERPAAPAMEGPANRVPFKTKEPENFQCEIVETAGQSVRRKRIAKKGAWRRIDFDAGETHERSLLQTDKEYLLDPGRGIYSEAAAGAGEEFSELTHELLNTAHHADFEETARDGSRVRYTVRPADGSSSEMVVDYDESIGLPVRQEFFSIENGERTLRLTVEIVNFKNEPDPGIFTIGAGLRKVPMEDLLRPSNG